jgi:hypothetical protein
MIWYYLLEQPFMVSGQTFDRMQKPGLSILVWRGQAAYLIAINKIVAKTEQRTSISNPNPRLKHINPHKNVTRPPKTGRFYAGLDFVHDHSGS